MKHNINQAQTSILETALFTARQEWLKLAQFENPSNPKEQAIVREQFTQQVKELDALIDHMDLDVGGIFEAAHWRP